MDDMFGRFVAYMLGIASVVAFMLLATLFQPAPEYWSYTRAVSTCDWDVGTCMAFDVYVECLDSTVYNVTSLEGVVYSFVPFNESSIGWCDPEAVMV